MNTMCSAVKPLNPNQRSKPPVHPQPALERIIEISSLDVVTVHTLSTDRRSLMIQEYKDRVLLKEVKVSPEEIEAYFRDHPEEFRESRVVVLRQILLDDPEEARRLSGILKADPGQFPVLARQSSIAPDRGQPRQYEEGELPEPLRAAVFALAPGEISEPLEDDGRVRIFQAVDQHEGKDLTLPEARGKIRLLLLQRRAEETLARAVADLKKEARIRVHLENLPFPYQGAYGP